MSASGNIAITVEPAARLRGRRRHRVRGGRTARLHHEQERKTVTGVRFNVKLP
ncbi:MAG: hypothetical protein ACLR0N_10215 [Bilophila wadsworthia]